MPASPAGVQALQVDYLLLMTGTPIQNNTDEIFTMFNLLDRVEFGHNRTRKQFRGSPPSPRRPDEQQQEAGQQQQERLAAQASRSFPG